MYLYSFATDPHACIYKNLHMAHKRFKNNKLFFTAGQTEANACEFIVLVVSSPFKSRFK